MIKITDEMRELAGEAWARVVAEGPFGDPVLAALEAVAPLIAKAEAEECAGIAVEEGNMTDSHGAAYRIADKILARHAKTASTEAE